MGLFESIFGRRDNQINGSSRWETLTAYAPTFTTRNESLYEYELVRSAIEYRATNVSKLKIEIIGSAQSQLKTKIKSRPNSFQTWSQFLARLSRILDMQNTAFIVPMYDKYERIVGFFPLLPSTCELVEAYGKIYARYRFKNGKVGSIELDKIGIMTKHQYTSDMFGESNNTLRPTAQLMDLNRSGLSEAVKNSATFRFMARVNNWSKTDDLKKEAARFNEANFRGEGGGILLFPNTYSDIKQIDPQIMTIDKSQLDLMKNNVFDYFGVNEKLLQNAATAEECTIFYENVVEWFAIQLSEVFSNMIFTEKELNIGNAVAATSNRLQYMSNKDKLSVSAQMADRGLMTINEIRDIWNLAPVEGGDRFPRRGEYYFDDENTKEEEEEQEAENEQ